MIVAAVKLVMWAESACKSLNLAESPESASICAESIVVLLEWSVVKLAEEPDTLVITAESIVAVDPWIDA